MKTKPDSDILLERFVVGPMGVNCYCLADKAAGAACLIDPGADPSRIKRFLSKNNLKLDFIINTHGHGDHIAANASFDAPIYIHESDSSCLTDPKKNLSDAFLFPVSSPKADRFLRHGDKITLGKLALNVIHTPGHTPGSISIHFDPSTRPEFIEGLAQGSGIIFTGDALFRGGIGRTDLYGGDEELLLKSIRGRLFVFDDETVIYPGHGEPSTIGEEKGGYRV